MRVQMAEIDGEINKKEEEYRSLLDLYSQLPRNVNRSVYTKRILDIVKQVKKQKVDINKILIDTRALQKDISSNIEALNRVFSLATEVIFQDAKKDAAAKQAYRDVVAIHGVIFSPSHPVLFDYSLISSYTIIPTALQRAV